MYRMNCVKCNNKWNSETNTPLKCPKCGAEGPQAIGFAYFEVPKATVQKVTEKVNITDATKISDR